ncbi:MAG: HupE/UreJ family protein [Labilithrix sp.]|nr:HupE/UreJ family protein [Labilithrix sp.]
MSIRRRDPRADALPYDLPRQVVRLRRSAAVIRRVGALLAVLCSLLLARVAWAHDARGEVVLLDVGERSVAVELLIPLSQLRVNVPDLFPGVDHDLASVEVDGVPEHVRTRLVAFDREHRPFVTTVDGAQVKRIDDGDVVVVLARLLAPEGSDARWFELHDDVILDHVVTHSVYVFLRRDLRAGDVDESASLLGELHHQQRALVVDRTDGGMGSVVRHGFELGIHHIAEGADHILFLLMLLLPAPLVAVPPRRWSAAGTVRRAVIESAKIASAFTIGHSATLAGATLLQRSSGPRLTTAIEIAIAASILVAAVHALRPLFSRHEALVAGGFGLVHGLAFASALVPFSFDRTTLLLSLLGFNLGVEAMQLAIIVTVGSAFALLSRGSSYALVRVGGSAFGVVAAIGWILERATGWRPLTSAWVDALARRGPWLLAALVLTVVVDAVAHRPRRSPASGSP